jgi:peroxiredoxin
MLGTAAPDFSLKDLEGNRVLLSDFSGKPVLLIHLNAYCHTCREEVPLFNKIYRENKDIQVVAIAIGNDNEEALTFKKNFKAEFLLLTDPQQEVYQQYYVHTVPLIDVIDRTGTIRYRGKIGVYAEFASIMENIVNEKEMVGPSLWNKPPDFTLASSEGESFHLYDSIGAKTIIITFLSVRDTFVRQVIEVMKSLYSRYKREDVEIVRIAVNNSSEEITQFKKDYYVTFPILVDEQGEVAKLFGVTEIPTTFVINKKGKIRYVSTKTSLDTLSAVLTKLKSYFREDLPKELLTDYLGKVAPGVKKFEQVTIGDNQVIYVGTSEENKTILIREVFKDVLCDVCTNVHFVYSFDPKGQIQNIVLIESIDLYGEPIDAQDFLQRVIKQADQKLPLKLRKDIDALTGATQSCKLILEGLNETPKILDSLEEYKAVLDEMPQ